MDNEHTGLLIHKSDVELHRGWFEEMCRLIGIQTIYKPPVDGKDYSLYGELNPDLQNAQLVWCIFEEHASQRTMRALGWNTEALESCPVIHVPYGLEGLQAGAVFIVQSGVDSNVGRVFKVLELANEAVYPASVACKLGPVLRSNFQEEDLDHDDNDFSVLRDIDSD